MLFFFAYFDPIKVLKENEKQENKLDIEYIFTYISTHIDFCTIYEKHTCIFSPSFSFQEGLLNFCCSVIIF